MGYRKKHPTSMDQWIKQNARGLVLLGIPEVIMSDKDRFLWAIYEGEDARSGWYSGGIKEENKARLRQVLKTAFTAEESRLLQCLEEPGQD